MMKKQDVCTQMIRISASVAGRMTRIQTTNLVEWDKFLGSISSVVGVLSEGAVNPSWADQGRLHGRGCI